MLVLFKFPAIFGNVEAVTLAVFAVLLLQGRTFTSSSTAITTAVSSSFLITIPASVISVGRFVGCFHARKIFHHFHELLPVGCHFLALSVEAFLKGGAHFLHCDELLIFCGERTLEVVDVFNHVGLFLG